MPQLKTIAKSSLIAALITLTACSSTSKGNTADLAGLQSLRGYAVTAPRRRGSNAIRLTALQETALAVGAQSALAWRGDSIDRELMQHKRTLDLAFNFQALVMDHNVLPPVLLEGRTTLNLSDNTAIRLSDRMYEIAKQARFVTAPPHWREYLWLNYKKPERPSNTLLPQNSRERKVWKKFVAQGWAKGIEQANRIFAEDLARLKQDYNGMALYRKLLAQNIVSAPFVAKTNLGITGDNNHLNINDTVLRITALPTLNKDSKTWRPALTAMNVTADKQTHYQPK